MPNNTCNQLPATAAVTTPVTVQVGVVSGAGIVDDIGKYLAAMKPLYFWRLVRKHRPWLTTKEAASLRGVSVRRLELLRANGKKLLPVMKGKFVRYYLGALDALQPPNHIPPATEATVAVQHVDTAPTKNVMDDVFVYLASMQSNEFWKLVRQHRRRLTT